MPWNIAYYLVSMKNLPPAVRAGARRFDLAQGRRAAGRYAGFMQLPLQISFHGIEHSNALYDAIREKAEKLERYYDRILSCRVVLGLAARHKRQGKHFSVRVDLKVPGDELAVTREHDEDIQVALREAFDAARRQLEDYARVQRGDVKRHAPGRTGRAR
jgi:ribosomal subunit interface protein